MALTVKRPADKSETVGAWIDHGKGDVHLYVNHEGTVFGKNPVHKDLKFSTPALCLSEHGTYLQVSGKNGEVKHIALNIEAVGKRLSEFLASLESNPPT